METTRHVMRRGQGNSTGRVVPPAAAIALAAAIAPGHSIVTGAQMTRRRPSDCPIRTATPVDPALLDW